MKIYNTKNFEKLNINPIKINEFKFGREIRTLDDIETYDIVFMCHKFYMFFKYEDFLKYSTYYENKNVNVCNGLFFRYDTKSDFRKTPMCFMPYYEFYENLKCKGCYIFNITDTYAHPFDFKIDKIEDLEQDYFKNILKTYNFKHTKINENI